MKNISLMNIITLFKNEIYKKRKSLLIFGIAIVSILALYMLLYPMVKNMFVDKLAAMPSELLELFGMGSVAGFANYNTYFGAIGGILIIAISIYALLYSTDIFHNEEESKTIEYTYSNPISRTELWISKVFAVKSILLLISFLVFISSTIFGLIVALDEVNILSMAISAIIIFIVSFFFSCTGLVLVSINVRIKPIAIGLSILLGLYLLGYLGSIGPEFIGFLKYLSPYSSISLSSYTTSTITESSFNWLTLIVFAIISIIFASISLVLYKKKDFK